MKSKSRTAALAMFAAVLLVQTAKSDNENHEPILPELAASSNRTVSTIPSNGDTNPYGVAFVPEFFFGGGALDPGDVLVSNFNNGASPSVQGTGTTIVKITPATTGTPSTFFQGTGLGLTTALGVLRTGFVLVGNLPTSGGTVVPPGSLLVLNRSGKLIQTLTDATLLDGPWDLTVNDDGFFAQVFVSNVLSGTVTRLDVLAIGDFFFQVLKKTQIASGYMFRTDPAALVIGPTGLAYDRNRDVLYVASTGDNEIFAIPSAGATHQDIGTGTVIYKDGTHLHGPLGLVLAPNGDLITSNGDAVNNLTETASQLNELIEFTPGGQFVAEFQLDNSGTPGGAFGIAITGSGANVRFAAVDDNTNSVTIWNVH